MFEFTPVVGEAMLDGEDGEFNIASDAQLFEDTIAITVDCLRVKVKVKVKVK